MWVTSFYVALPQFHFLRKIKNFDFERYFHLSERGRITVDPATPF